MGLTVAMLVTIRLPDESLLRTVAAEQSLLAITTIRDLERRSSDGAKNGTHGWSTLVCSAAM